MTSDWQNCCLMVPQMRFAVPIWEGRVSPVFDVATQLLVVEVIAGEAAFTEEHRIWGADRAGAVAELGIDLLICGAISRQLEDSLLASGVGVIAEVRGPVNDVIRAYLAGSIIQPSFLMPGCHGRWRRGRARWHDLDDADPLRRSSDVRGVGTVPGQADEKDGKSWAVH